MTEPHDRAIVAVVGELRMAVATLTEAVKTLQATSVRLERNSVSREAHDALKEDVGDLKIEARAGIARNDDRWAKVAWFVGLFILAALLGLLVSQGGLK
jgi:hypothetical protein